MFSVPFKLGGSPDLGLYYLVITLEYATLIQVSFVYLSRTSDNVRATVFSARSLQAMLFFLLTFLHKHVLLVILQALWS